MKRDVRSFLSGCLVTAVAISLTGTVAATVAQKTLTADYNNIKVTLDGQSVNLVDANGAAVEPFAVSGTTYLPVRAVADALGLNVAWDGNTQTVVLTSGNSTGSSIPDHVSSNIGEYHVTIDGAKFSKDYDGNPAIIVTCTWTNNSDETTCAMSELIARAYQNGVELESAFMTGDDFDANTLTNLRPGASTQIQYAFELDGSSAPVEFELSEIFALGDTGSVTKTFAVD